MTFDPNIGREIDDAWIWPCGCVVQRVLDGRELLARACSTTHDDPLDALLVATAADFEHDVEFVRVYPDTN